MSGFPWFRRGRDRALEQEIRTHLELAARDRIASGESPDAAAQHARREFGNVTHVKEVTRDHWGGAAFERFVQDLRFAVRSLLRVPAFTCVAVLTMALGIGANTAIFSVVNGVILRPLPYPHPERLLYISSQYPGMNLDHFPVDLGEFLDLRDWNKSFESLAGFVPGAVNLGATDAPTRVVPTGYAAGDFFKTIGVAPNIGRAFTEEDMRPNAPPVAVLSHELWQTSFGGDRSVLNRDIDIDGVKTTVVGILPPTFDFRDQGARIWLPVTYDAAQRNTLRGGHFLFLLGRLKPNVTPRQAVSELQSLLVNWAPADGQPAGVPVAQAKLHTPTPTDHRLRYDDLQADIVGPAAPALWILQGAVALVLLIACANLANLLLVRADSRRKELALRSALGAGQWRLARQFVAESVVLSLAGAAVGVVLAQFGLHALLATNGGSLPRTASVQLDGTVLAFTLIVAVGTGIAFGLAPLAQVRRASISTTLHGTSGRTTSGRDRNRARNILVVAEMALAVMLVVGAGLLTRSFWNLMKVDSGFDRTHLTTFNVVLSTPQYSDLARRTAFIDDLTSRLGAIPGVAAAAAMSGLPPLRPINANDTQIEGYVVTPNGPAQNVDYYQWVTPDYLSAMHIPVVAGRGFGPGDGPTAGPVVLINQTLAKRFFPGQDPLGRRLRPGGSTTFFTIVGIVKDVKQQGLGSQTGTELYLNYDQSPAYLRFMPGGVNAVIRSPQRPADLASAIHRVLTELDPTIPVANLQSMEDVFAAAASQPHFLVELLLIFAAIALALAAIGTYGVLSYVVSERRREFGIRMALGAARQGVLTTVLVQGMTLAALGLGLGLVGAIALTRVARALLFDVSPTDPVTFAAVALFIGVVALGACVIPAWGATRVDPSVALRTE